jgi:hypothetical protein
MLMEWFRMGTCDEDTRGLLFLRDIIARANFDMGDRTLSNIVRARDWIRLCNNRWGESVGG